STFNNEEFQERLMNIN
ncbi:unnamed protein product, partial [Rotaria sordida]